MKTRIARKDPHPHYVRLEVAPMFTPQDEDFFRITILKWVGPKVGMAGIRSVDVWPHEVDAKVAEISNGFKVIRKDPKEPKRGRFGSLI